MNFEACRSAKQGSNKLTIEKSTLELAIEHVAEREKAIPFLDTLVERPAINDEAEIILATIRIEYDHSAKNGEIILSRSELVRRFRNHGKRGKKTVKDLDHVITYLIQIGEARKLPKVKKLQPYAFCTEK
jgi:hypothetical protein